MEASRHHGSIPPSWERPANPMNYTRRSSAVGVYVESYKAKATQTTDVGFSIDTGMSRIIIVIYYFLFHTPNRSDPRS